VGDAGYHKDPIGAQGISDAFRDAELLADAVDQAFSGRQSIDQTLAQYEQKRNDAVMAMYRLNCEMASHEPPPPEMQQLFAALQDNQSDTDRFMGTLAGSVPVTEFFAPENTQRIIAAGAH
jgi:2-polyprenyl-6-methoxyphenol hydroxylase-like FAD-dependent oxidoreductase